MQSEHSGTPAAGPDAMAGAVATSDAARLNAAAQKILYYAVLIGGIGLPALAWLYVTLRGLVS